MARVHGAKAERSGPKMVAGRSRSLDRIIHERLRLGIVGALSVNEMLTFKELKKILGTTDGNLSGTRASWKKPATWTAEEIRRTAAAH